MKLNTWIVVGLLSLHVGCAGGEEEPVAASMGFCEKVDECNALQVGVSVDDCTDSLNMCVDTLVSSERADWESSIQDCLKLTNCSNFIACWEAVPGC